MRLVTIDSRETGGRPGIWLPSGEILDPAAAPAGLRTSRWLPASVVSVLAQGEEGLGHVRRMAEEVGAADALRQREWREAGALLPFAGTALMPPVRRPGLLLVTRQGAAAQPCYIKNPNTAVGDQAIIAAPRGADRLHVAAALGLVIGRAIHDATPVEAGRALAGCTLLADLGREAWPAMGTEGRHFPGACPIGPAVLTRDEWALAPPVALGLRINGHCVASVVMAPDMAQHAETIALLSRHHALRPGDIIALRIGDKEATVGRSDTVTLSFGDLLTLRFTMAA